jgi:HSP20 family molecular chaperone IbpA
MWAEALAMIDRAEQLHRQFCQPGLGAGPRANWEPPVDVFENGRDVLIVVALPGVESQDLEVRSEPDALVVERLEIPHGQFERRIRLPAARWQLQRSMLANGCLLLNLTRQP